MKRAATPSREELFAAVPVLFAAPDQAEAAAMLEGYDGSAFKESRERVQMAALGLSKGSLPRLRELIDRAQADYRDVLYWYEFVGPGTLVRAAIEARLAEAGLPPWPGAK